MLTPEYLLHCSEGAEQIASELHTAILKRMIAKINLRKEKGYDYKLTATDKWHLENLTDAGYLQEDIQQEIAKYTGYQVKEIEEAMTDAGVKALSYDDKIYRKAGMEPTPIQKSPHMQRLLQRGYEKTAGSWKNLTATTANACHQQFVKSLDSALAEVATGNTGYIEAYTNAIDKIIEDGVTITYPSGHVDTIETATLRALRTGVSQTTGDIQTERMKEMDWDLVLVSSHQGARPTHQVWQGKVYSRKGPVKGYADFVTSTHYGEGDGLCGWNCRHHFMPYVEGMENPFKDYSNKENIEIYELTQEQRRMERNIRKTKRQIEGYLVAQKGAVEGSADMAHINAKLEGKRSRLRAQNAAYKEFCKEHDLRPLPERLAIAKAGRHKEDPEEKGIDIQIVPRSRAGNEPPAPPVTLPPTPPVAPPAPEPPTPAPPASETPEIPEQKPKKVYVQTEEIWPGHHEESAQIAKEYGALVNGCGSEDLIDIFSRYGNWFYYEYSSQGRYEGVDKKVYWHFNDPESGKGKYATLAHEMGHGFDFAIGRRGIDVSGQRSNVYKAMQKAGGQALARYGPSMRPSQSDKFIKALRNDIKALKTAGIEKEDSDLIRSTKHETSGFEDLLDGVFGTQEYSMPELNIPQCRFGHGSDYYNRKFRAAMNYGVADDLITALNEYGVDTRSEDGSKYGGVIELLKTYEISSELWANITNAIVNEKDGSKDLYLIKKYCPDTYDAYMELLKQHIEFKDMQDAQFRAGVGSVVNTEAGALNESGTRKGKAEKEEEKTAEDLEEQAKRASDTFRKGRKTKDEPPVEAEPEGAGEDLYREEPVFEGASDSRREKYTPDKGQFHPTSEYFRDTIDEEFGYLISNCKYKDLIELYNHHTDDFTYVYAKDGKAYYNPSTKEVYWHFADTGQGSLYSTLAHEMGHAIDFAIDSKGVDRYRVRDAFEFAMPNSAYAYIPDKRPSQSDTFMAAVWDDMQYLLTTMYVDEKDILDEDGDWEDGTDGFQDFLDGAFGAQTTKLKWLPKVRWGHGEEYYDRKFNRLKELGSVESTIEKLQQKGVNIEDEWDLKRNLRAYETASELWANINSAYSIRKETDTGWKVFQKYCPNSMAAYKQLVRDHLKAVHKEEKENGGN